MENILKRIFTNRPREARRDPDKAGLDTTPIAKPVGFNSPPSIRDQVLAAIRYHTELARTAEAESFEEADDFGPPDSDFPEFGKGHELPDDVASLEPWNEKGQRAEAIKQAHARFKAPPQGQQPAAPGGAPASAAGSSAAPQQANPG